MDNQNNQTNQTSDRSLITEKEHLYVKDMMSWELLAMKKCHDAASRCENAEFTNLINSIGQQHERNYKQLLGQLQ